MGRAQRTILKRNGTALPSRFRVVSEKKSNLGLYIAIPLELIIREIENLLQDTAIFLAFAETHCSIVSLPKHTASLKKKV
jgi:hypothetical protein